MHQSLHIFEKDVRYLKHEILLFLSIAILLAAMHKPEFVQVIEFAMVGAAAFLIGRLVLAETIPGDRQFWITRPYRWQNLLAAKLLFIVVFVNLPVLLADLFILIVDGFPFGPSLPGLLWSQVLLFTFVALPFAALAALSSGMAAFIFAQLIVLVAGYGAWELFVTIRPASLGGVNWVRDAAAFLALCAIATPVLFVQYKKRNTVFSRWFASAGIVAAALAYIAVPFPLALALQTHLTKQPSLGSGMQIAFDRTSDWQYWSRPLGPKVLLHVPISVQSIPDGTEFLADALSISLQSPDGRTARVKAGECPDLMRRSLSAGAVMVYANCLLDETFFRQERGQPLTLRASLYFTLFGNARSQTIPLSHEPSNALDGLQCYTNAVKAEWDVYCRSAFRWPDRLVYAKLGHSNADSFAQFVSYSPFPASLNIDPIETRWASAYPSGPPPTVRDVTITVEEPLAHLRRDFEAPNVNLNRLASQPVGTVRSR
jgi:hypothetical protein